MPVRTRKLRDEHPAGVIHPGALLSAGGVPREPLTATPEAVRKQAIAIAGLRARMGGPDLRLPDGQQIAVKYDSQAYVIAARAGRVLSDGDPVALKAGVRPSLLDADAQKYRCCRDMRLSAEIDQRRVSDTRRLVLRRLSRMTYRLVGTVLRALADLPPGSPAHTALQSDAAALLFEWRTRQKSVQERAQKTRAQQRDLDLALERIDQDRRLAQALVDLKEDRPIDPALEAELADAYLEATDEAEDLENRRNLARDARN